LFQGEEGAESCKDPYIEGRGASGLGDPGGDHVKKGASDQGSRGEGNEGQYDSLEGLFFQDKGNASNQRDSTHQKTAPNDPR
jgi:hypothetical protein